MIDWILRLPKELAVLIVGALPVFELRGAIPLGFYLKMPLFKTVILSVTGNLLPIIPILFFLQPVSEILRKFPLWNKFFEWLFERTKRKSDIIQRYEAIGLAVFVAIPLPITGAWTGAVAASLFKIKFRYAFAAIVAGVIIAAVLVSCLCLFGIFSYKAIFPNIN
ncbi:MAG: small multi-drug export protein [Candidatus Omnitrophota bacterium]